MERYLCGWISKFEFSQPTDITPFFSFSFFFLSTGHGDNRCTIIGSMQSHNFDPILFPFYLVVAPFPSVFVLPLSRQPRRPVGAHPRGFIRRRSRGCNRVAPFHETRRSYVTISLSFLWPRFRFLTSFSRCRNSTRHSSRVVMWIIPFPRERSLCNDAIGEIDDRGDVCAKLFWEAGDISTSLSFISIYFPSFQEILSEFTRKNFTINIYFFKIYWIRVNTKL